MGEKTSSQSTGLELPKRKPVALLAFAKPFHTTGSDDPEIYALIGFRDRDGSDQITSVLAGQLVTKQTRLIEHLVNRGLPWSEAAQAEVDRLGTADTSARAIITFAPGWHGGVFVLPDGSFAADGASNEAIRFTSHQAVKLGPFRTEGSLKSWQRDVAYVGKHSSRARLFIALPFAATVLRLIHARSFGVVVVGVSSKGKTLLLRLGASVLGHNGEQELTNMLSTPTAIQELMLGHRDGFVPLDELGLVEGDDHAVTILMKSLSFMASTGRGKNRASAYEQAVKAIKADSRVIIGITSEVSIAQIAARANSKRLRGEEVRLIEIPTAREAEGDIFDGKEADAEFGSTSAERGKAVKRLERACEENQGVALRVFLSHLVNDEDAADKLNAWVAECENAAHDLNTDSSRGRIISSLATPYAAARLAIEYGVLRWKAKPTLQAILKCIRDALDHLSSFEKVSGKSSRSVDALISDFVERLKSGSFIRMDGKRPTRSALEGADGFRRFKKHPLLLKSEVFHSWYPNRVERGRLIDEMQKRGALPPGSHETTNTVQVQISALSSLRRPYYAIRVKKLMPK